MTGLPADHGSRPAVGVAWAIYESPEGSPGCEPLYAARMKEIESLEVSDA